MSKDPAFLFYSNDFLSGTYLMSDEQVGRYIRLLCYEHQNGRLTEQDMLKICQSYDKDIFRHFKTDDDGLFYNLKLETEVNRRNAYSASRRANRNVTCETHDKDMSDICETHVEHMETVTETVTKKEDSSKNSSCFVKPTVAEIQTYCAERNNSIVAQQFFDYNEARGWMLGKGKMKDWKAAVRTWESRSKQTCQSGSGVTETSKGVFKI